MSTIFAYHLNLIMLKLISREKQVNNEILKKKLTTYFTLSLH